MSTLNTLCAIHEKGPFAICGQLRPGSTCSSMQPDLGILCLSKYTTVATDSVSRLKTQISLPHKLHKGPFGVLHIICFYEKKNIFLIYPLIWSYEISHFKHCNEASVL